MARITLLGFGNVGQHLFYAFKKAGHQIIQVYNRTFLHVQPFVALFPKTRFVENLHSLSLDSDLYLIAVSDNAIQIISENLPTVNVGGVVAHTSGATSIKVLNTHPNYGVFYPLQTFTAGHEVDFSRIPICIDGDTESTIYRIEKIAQSLSKLVYRINDRQRSILHVAAVFANNFTNHLFAIAAEICRENKIPFDILKPLIAETIHKIQTQSPDLVQTGPAKRKDLNTIQTHLRLLEEQPEFRKIYQMLSDNIIQMHSSKSD